MIRMRSLMSYDVSVLLLLLLLLLLVTAASAEGESSPPVVSTEGGKVSGILEEATNGKVFYSYYGIPYAQPPLGDIRFKDPVNVDQWEGIRDGSSMPSPCLQVPFGMMMAGIKLPPEELHGKEDCLYLNVFTPEDSLTKGEEYPVMVYIHGGAFFSGGAEEYLPHVLLNKDVILVVIQYRLGFLGFLSTEDWVLPGNYGLKDQTFALSWVQRNIRNFGGNPDKVTIFGQSAGGASVHYQMLTPKAKGLFSGAIMQSGCALSPWALHDHHKKTAQRLGAMVGCNLDEGSRSFLSCMQSADARKINAAVSDFFIWFVFPFYPAPRVDGDYLPEHPAKLMKDGRYTKVNLMAGSTAHEGAIVTQGMYGMRGDTLESLKKNYSDMGPVVAGFLPEDEAMPETNAIFNYYLGGVNVDAEYGEDMTEMMNDILINQGLDIVTGLHASDEGTSTYRYKLAHRAQISMGDFLTQDVGQHWVPHADDLLYLFRGGPFLTPSNQPSERPKDLTTPEDLTVRNFMVSLWTNFATYGNPTPNESLGFRWDPASPKDLNYLELLTSPSMKEDSRKESRKFMSSLPTKTNLILNRKLAVEKLPGSRSTKRHQDEF